MKLHDPVLLERHAKLHGRLMERLVVMPCRQCESKGCSKCDGQGGVPTPSSWKACVEMVRNALVLEQRELAITVNFVQTLRRYEGPKAMDLAIKAYAYAGDVSPTRRDSTPRDRVMAAIDDWEDGFLRSVRDPADDGPFDREAERIKALRAYAVLEADLRTSIRTLEDIVDNGASLLARWTESLKEPTKEPTPEPETKPTPRRTKASGQVCWKAYCGRDAKVWDAKGHGWCRRDAPKRLRSS